MKDMTSANSFGLYQLITNIGDLDSGEKYIIVSRNTENETDAYYVMDEYEETVTDDEPPIELVRRKNQLYNANDDIILYTGNYAVTIEKDGNNYYLYDLYNKEYLRAPEMNKLGLGDKDNLSKTTINITNGVAEIKFVENNTYIRNNNFITSCYALDQTSINDICLYKYIGTEILDKLETPTNIRETLDNKKVTIQWNEEEDASSYTVTLQDEEGEQNKKVVTECQVVFDDLENGYSYF